MLQDPRHPHEAGQVLPLVAVIVMLAGVLVLGIARVGTRAATKARAQAAADATALAAVDGDAQVAQRVAAANGAVVVRVVPTPGGAFVEVAFHGEHAVAQAARGDAAASRAAPALRAALARAEQVLGRPVPVLAVDTAGLAAQVDVATIGLLAPRGKETGLCAVRERPPGWFEICSGGGG